MTTINKIAVKCQVCGVINEFEQMKSSNQSGAPDLDSRPPEMLRSTIEHWIQRCRVCGYCAPDISEGHEYVGEFIQSSAYSGQLDNPSYPHVANQFLCWAMIQESVGELVEAGWACVHAAWVCDDEVTTIGANICRMKVIDLFRRARRKNLEFAQPIGAEDALLADLYRRCGEFERAVTMVQVGLLKKPDETIKQTLYYQVELVKTQDVACHTIDEAIKFSEKSIK